MTSSSVVEFSELSETFTKSIFVSFIYLGFPISFLLAYLSLHAAPLFCFAFLFVYFCLNHQFEGISNDEMVNFLEEKKREENNKIIICVYMYEMLHVCI